MVEKVSQRGLAHPLALDMAPGSRSNLGQGVDVAPDGPSDVFSLTETWLLQRVFWA